MKQIKNIIFDFGGVLIDWNPVYLYSKVFETEDEINFFLDNICTYPWNVLQDAGRSLEEATLEKQLEHPKYKEEIGMYYGRWDEMLGGEFEENTALVAPLKERYNVYGLTNWSAETLPIAIERYEFFRHLDGIVVSGDEKLVKPDLQIYKVLLDRYDINAHESLFIDDNLANIEAACELGFHTIHYTPEVNLKAELESAGVL